MESAAVNMMAIDERMTIAFLADIMMFAQVAPYIKQRQEVAKRYFHGGHLTQQQRDELIELVDRLNNDIKKIMGIK